ncbi:hypothetical protein ACA910_005845 [Epithemia clementina (nom. ined.)]
MRKVCILNIGLYRTGSTTFASAAAKCGLGVFREFPKEAPETLQKILVDPTQAVQSWWYCKGKHELFALVQSFDLVGDGYVSLLCFLPGSEILSFVESAGKEGIKIVFVATQRSVENLVESELHHWVREDLETRTGLSIDDRCRLEDHLRVRGELHARKLDTFPCNLTILKLEEKATWEDKLDLLFRQHEEMKLVDWTKALEQAGHQNKSPPPPVEGILLTMRIGQDTDEAKAKIARLLTSLTVDRLCQYQVVFGVDHDEAHLAETTVKPFANNRVRVDIVKNTERLQNEPFPICQIWDSMARRAFDLGADWVVLLGDDVDINCQFHARAFYRAFLNISESRNLPLWFGCPWWDDESFPGFPTFPAVGRKHFEIFGSLIPKHRSGSFINQDLDPYLQRLYLKFGAAPLVQEAKLRNQTGGDVDPPRYDPIYAPGWRNWVIEDVQPMRNFLMDLGVDCAKAECVLVDVVVPSYRINFRNLEAVCKLKVPSSMRTCFIIIVDNPDTLKAKMHTNNLFQAQKRLEEHLANICGVGNIRARCNETNLGASASRNRGLDESAAEFVLFLDDDIIPQENLLIVYEEELRKSDSLTVGLVGLTWFPRSPELSILHAGVLMSYLTFMFEIAASRMYAYPAWGVTANLLVKRIPQARFDTAYAKTGGGEDVDFCLRLLEATGGHLRSVPTAKVIHEFWPGGLQVLLPHFFNWAVGDGALFERHTNHTYYSWPNVVEFFLFWFILFSLFSIASRPAISSFAVIVATEALALFWADVLVEISNRHEFRHRKRLLLGRDDAFSPFFYHGAHWLANFYVVVLESGRLYGHWTRGEIFKNARRRFDWHCGRLPNASANFVRREKTKFFLFCIISLFVLCMNVGSPPGNNEVEARKLCWWFE